MSEIVHFIKDIAEGKHLSRDESARMFQIMMSGGATPAHIAAALMGLRMNGETVDEITGGAMAIRNKAAKLKVPEALQDQLLDTCGTGGDARRTYNISTAVAFVVAACGVPVAKHGNRAVSSRSGSSDALIAAGVDVEADVELMEQALAEEGICFLFAPKFHAAMRHVAPVRQELKMRTIFNLLGPLSNPAGAKRQLLGVYDAKWTEPLARVLHHLGSVRAWVVHGADGLDELTVTGPSMVAELKDGEVKSFEVHPEELGFELAEPKALVGGDAIKNAMEMKAVFSGKEGAYRDVVLLNAAAALVVAEKVDSLADGVEMAKEAIASGGAKAKLEALVAITITA